VDAQQNITMSSEREMQVIDHHSSFATIRIQFWQKNKNKKPKFQQL